MMLGVIIDVVIAILMAVTIFYCWKLNRYLELLRNSKSELAEVIEEFNEATNKAQDTINELKIMTKRIAEKMQVRIEKAEFIADDLAYLIDKGNKVASRIDPNHSSGSGSRSAKASPPATTSSSRSRSMTPAEETPPPRARKSGIESIARKTSRQDEPSASSSGDDDGDEKGGRKKRSKAEMELLQALKSIR